MSLKDSTVAAVIIALAGAATVTAGAGLAAADPACPTVMNFVVGGTGDPDGQKIEQVPDGERTYIHYPASIAPVAGSVGGDDSVRIAETGLDTPVPVFETCGTWDGICNAPNPFVDPVGTVKAAIGYATGSHVYSDDPVPAVAGDNLVEAETILTRLIPDVPVPDVDVPAAHEVLEPVTQALVPEHAIDIGAPYEPTPIGEYLPPIMRDNIPLEWSSVVLPPIPMIALPKVAS